MHLLSFGTMGMSGCRSRQKNSSWIREGVFSETKLHSFGSLGEWPQVTGDLRDAIRQLKATADMADISAPAKMFRRASRHGFPTHPS